MDRQGVIAIDTALYLADYLVRSGVHRVYVVPEPEVVTALNAFRLRGLQVVSAPDPTGAAMLAAAESAVYGVSGVVVSAAGPSAAAIAPAAAQAQLERRSLIAITIEPNGSQPRSTVRRRLDLRGIFASVSKGSYRLSAENARELVPLAWRLATIAPRGVVHLRVNSDELNKTAPPARGQTHPPTTPPNPEHVELLDRASQMIAGARRIALLVGPETLDARADTAARLLAEQWGSPLVVTPMAKGAVPETHPAFAGIYGGLGDHPIVELIEQSDLVVGFGVSSADFVRPWRSSVPTIHLTAVGADPGFAAEVTLVGPLNALANELPRQAAGPGDGDGAAAAARRAIREAIAPPEPARDALTAQRVLEGMRQVTTPDTPLAVETDPAGLLAAQLWTVTEPGAFLISNGLGLPGSGLALAIVAAFGRDGQPVLWLGTDASLLARPGLLSHLRDIDGSVTLVILNQGLHLELLRAQEAAGYPRIASEYLPPNIEAMASAFGLGYSRVRAAADLSSALAAAVTAQHPTLLDIEADRDIWWRIA